MTTPRLNFTRTKKGPVLLILFGAEVQAGRFSAAAAFVAAPIKRPVQMYADGQKVRVNPVNWAGFSMERPFLDQIHIEVLHGN